MTSDHLSLQTNDGREGRKFGIARQKGGRRAQNKYTKMVIGRKHMRTTASPRESLLIIHSPVKNHSKTFVLLHMLSCTNLNYKHSNQRAVFSHQNVYHAEWSLQSILDHKLLDLKEPQRSSSSIPSFPRKGNGGQES